MSNFQTEDEWKAAIDAADAALVHALTHNQIAFSSTNGQAVAIRRRLAGDIARAVILSNPDSDILDGAIRIS